jgi:hypothetical protein
MYNIHCGHFRIGGARGSIKVMAFCHPFLLAQIPDLYADVPENGTKIPIHKAAQVASEY